MALREIDITVGMGMPKIGDFRVSVNMPKIGDRPIGRKMPKVGDFKDSVKVPKTGEGMPSRKSRADQPARAGTGRASSHPTKGHRIDVMG